MNTYGINVDIASLEAEGYKDELMRGKRHGKG